VKDSINPSHYKQGNIEVIDFILDQKMSYLEGNVIKYISRYKFKNGLEDLNKAKWYTNKLIEEYNNENN
jgi:adenine-specific DNA glycosylase